MRKTVVNPQQVKKTDIVVGIPSYQEADNIAFVAAQASRGLTSYFPRLQGAIVNCDNNSPDDTKGVFLKAETTVPKIYISTPPGIAGKGYNFENLYRLVKELGAKIVVVVDADLESITPEWIKYFAEPILKKGFDYVTPVYSRHKYDGTITNNICFPLTYGLFGKNIRQPIGGDFAFSRRLCLYWLRQPWNTAVRQYGIDIFQSSHAVMGGFKICQTGLGSKIHKPSAPKLGPMFVQVVQSLFSIIVANKRKLQRVKRIQNTPQYGLKKLGKAQDLKVSLQKIRAQALTGFSQSQRDIKRLLSADNYAQVEPMFRRKKLNIPPELWIRMVFDMIAAFSQARTPQQQERLAEALKPLYFGRVTTIIKKTYDWSTPRTEKEFLAQARLFFQMRKYLIDQL
jgi:hypothetical protein